MLYASYQLVMLFCLRAIDWKETLPCLCKPTQNTFYFTDSVLVDHRALFPGWPVTRVALIAGASWSCTALMTVSCTRLPAEIKAFHHDSALLIRQVQIPQNCFSLQWILYIPGQQEVMVFFLCAEEYWMEIQSPNGRKIPAASLNSSAVIHGRK